ncbi:UDP-glucose 4-epimerase family protein [Stutzerimonas stutzeri]|uniref:UDP-glucose 4-epimerase family protein n=1 Tax=Stutzerimonas stutzeri TaxID=316 RepID=UPI00265B48DE|nr:SDR family oxidoreductase [Stutzerimonas stutzeri]MCF6781778.1 SDR family oxidoreductase [Stutzerimonas stutzeri]MCF6804447.1 SDR family oxidoreductase [Stutzerimonas stutzeri]
MAKLLLSGARGFVGSLLFSQLNQNSGFQVVGLCRRLPQGRSSSGLHAVGDLQQAVLSPLLPGVDVLIHAAARAHIMKDEEIDPLSEYRRVNVEGTLNLARQAVAAGVKRFIFISSIGVNGNIGTRPFRADDEPNPAEPYAQSKWEAEQGLMHLAAETGMEVVIIRPPLVYGPGAPGNFGSLVRWIESGVPLPLGAIHNKRSLVGIDNLVDLIVRCVDHPAAANQVFLAGDGEDISTTELLRGVGKAMGKPARLIPVPAGLLQLGATLLGKKAMAQRLLGSLQVDISKTCELLDWKPPYTVEEGLKRCFERSN